MYMYFLKNPGKCHKIQEGDIQPYRFKLYLSGGWGRFGDNAGHHSIHQVIIITCMYTSIQMSFLQIIKVEGI